MLGNLGNKDRRGRQARIGHHGRKLRVSRTGGVSLRHAVRTGRIGLSANTSRGLRLSSALGRGTQVASQNGRFILRGRYGKGPVKFNLSKSGLSASLASDVGRLNLTNPGRSSAKLFGVQVRGRKAASINAGMLAATAVVALIKMAVVLLVVTAKALAWLVAAATESAQALLARWQTARSNKAFGAHYAELEAFTGGLDSALLPDDASRLRLIGHLLLNCGRFDSDQLKSRLQERGASLRSKRQRAELTALADPIELGSETTANMDLDRRQTWCLLAARGLFHGKDSETVLELFLALDDLCLAVDDRTEAQEDLLALIAEAGRIRLSVQHAGEVSASEIQDP
ncbi:MAG: hypothetical protein EA419_10225, partial [Wenzhouxiangella sp.]